MWRYPEYLAHQHVALATEHQEILVYHEAVHQAVPGCQRSYRVRRPRHPQRAAHGRPGLMKVGTAYPSVAGRGRGRRSSCLRSGASLLEAAGVLDKCGTCSRCRRRSAGPSVAEPTGWAGRVAPREQAALARRGTRGGGARGSRAIAHGEPGAPVLNTMCRDRGTDRTNRSTVRTGGTVATTTTDT
eukprot:12664798-Alexandrium_andersonii.AAC.2